MSEHTPAAAAAPSAAPASLPLGMRVLLTAFYLHLAVGGGLLLCLLALLGGNSFGSDVQFIFWGGMVPLAPLIFFSLRAILAVHARHNDAPGRSLHVLYVNIFLMVLIAIAFCWFMALNGYSWQRGLTEMMGIALFSVLANILFLWIAWHYLRHSPLVWAAFGAAPQSGEAGAGENGPQAGRTSLYDDLPVPAGIHLFTIVCILTLVYKGFKQTQFISWLLTDGVTFSSSALALSISVLQGILQLILLGSALFIRFKRPARALTLIQACLGGFVACQSYLMVRLFLRSGWSALDSSTFVLLSGYALSAVAFLLYFKTSVLARAFLSRQPLQRTTLPVENTF